MVYRQPFRGDWPITQRYGEKITSAFHTGIDYGCPVGTEILASADGMVMAASWDDTGYGLRVIIQHTADRATVYAHLSKINVIRGEKVRQGQVIGLSGKSGNVTGPHLHFEARYDWAGYRSHFDPMTLPLMNMVDAAPSTEPRELLPSGVYKVACEYAFIRTWDTLQRDRILNKGERVYIFEDAKNSASGLPFRFIGAGRCIAEYDTDGTQILEKDDGNEED